MHFPLDIVCVRNMKLSQQLRQLYTRNQTLEILCKILYHIMDAEHVHSKIWVYSIGKHLVEYFCNFVLVIIS